MMRGRQTISDFLRTCVTRGHVPCVVASVATAGDLLYLEAFGKSAVETQPSDPEMRSPGSLSWAGIFNTYFWIDPLKELAAVVMMQLLPGNDEKAVDLFRGFERLVYAG